MNLRRHPRRIALVFVALLLGIPAAVVGIGWLAYNTTVTTDVSVAGSGLVSANGRTVSVIAGALCDDTVNLTADEQPTSVVITLHDTHPRAPQCSGMPGFAVYHVLLPQPLGRRWLRDGVTGDRIPFFDLGNDLLVVTQGGTLLRARARPRRITVNGHPALEFTGVITWTAHGQRLTVSAEDLPSAQLVAVADSMPA